MISATEIESTGALLTVESGCLVRPHRKAARIVAP